MNTQDLTGRIVIVVKQTPVTPQGPEGWNVTTELV